MLCRRQERAVPVGHQAAGKMLRLAAKAAAGGAAARAQAGKQSTPSIDVTKDTITSTNIQSETPTRHWQLAGWEGSKATETFTPNRLGCLWLLAR